MEWKWGRNGGREVCEAEKGKRRGNREGRKVGKQRKGRKEKIESERGD